jgi:ABC-type multidrug transport system fused ATPase/permease subunit
LAHNDKIRALLFLGAALTSIILLAMGMSNLVFTGGMPLSVSESESSQSFPMMLPFSEAVITILRIFVALLILAVPIYIYLMIVNKNFRKRAIRDLMIIMGFILLILVLRPRLMGEENEEIVEEGPPVDFTQSEIPTLGDPLDFMPPETPDYLVLGVIFGIALLISSAVIVIYFRIQRKKRKQYQDMDKLAAEAQEAVDSIRAGEDFKDTILRCYYRMSTVIQSERRIQRQNSMTPREFEYALSRIGLPVTPVRNLTRLFEDVRYGSLNKGKRDEELAVLSLMEIVDYCQNPGTQSGAV